MKPIVAIESHIPEIPERLDEFFDVRRVAPEAIDASAVADADALIVRTRTRCDASLLEGSRVSFVATATIGTDHLDLPYLASRSIEAVSAPGCNAPAVAQYVYASLTRLFPEGLEGKTIGVVGVGHVGSIVARWGAQLSMRVLMCDPPRALVEGADKFVDLSTIASEADIVTFHVPHTTTGPHATHHLADGGFFASLGRRPIIINSARGPIVDTAALVDAYDNRQVGRLVIDCWEGEPSISRRLLDRATIATPHIAGYSLNGKLRATATVVNALCRHFGVDYRFEPTERDGRGDVLAGRPIPAGAAERVSAEAIMESYDPMVDTERLRNNPDAFERLRNTYQLRPEVISL